MISRNEFKLLALAAGFIGAVAASSEAHAQSGLYESYAFPQTNRGSMAVIIKQAESGMFTTGSGSAGDGSGSGGPLFLCGGSGGGSSTSSSSSATANSSCIILNNSTGSITIDQNSKGNQTSNSGIDQVNEALQNNPATQ